MLGTAREADDVGDDTSACCAAELALLDSVLDVVRRDANAGGSRSMPLLLNE